jgi:hypothetical protein
MRYLNVEFKEDGIREYDRYLVAVFLPLSEIQRVELSYGTVAERPLIQIVVGFSLLVLGCAFLEDLLLRLVFQMPFYKYLAAGIALVPLGVWLVYEGFSKGYLLLVTTAKDTRKIVFRGPVDQQALLSFVTSVQEIKKIEIQVGAAINPLDQLRAVVAARSRRAVRIKSGLLILLVLAMAGWFFYRMLTQVARSCEDGDADSCGELAWEALQRGDDQETHRYVELGCRAGNGKLCRVQAAILFEGGHDEQGMGLLERACQLGDPEACTVVKSQDQPSLDGGLDSIPPEPK